MTQQLAVPTREAIRAEAVCRVDARHRGFVPPAPDVLADEYDREALHVASLARQYPWEQVVTIAPKVAAVEALDREVAELQAFDHDRALTHYRGALGRLEDERAGRR